MWFLGKDGAVSLVAHTALSHLTTHLGHFPLARGASVLTCRVSEHHDADDTPDELSAKLFESPNVQVSGLSSTDQLDWFQEVLKRRRVSFAKLSHAVMTVRPSAAAACTGCVSAACFPWPC